MEPTFAKVAILILPIGAAFSD